MNTEIPYALVPEDDAFPSEFDRIIGVVLNMLAGIGLFSFIVACVIGYGYFFGKNL